MFDAASKTHFFCSFFLSFYSIQYRKQEPTKEKKICNEKYSIEYKYCSSCRKCKSVSDCK